MLFNQQQRSLNRNKLLFKHLNLPEQGSILDLSCGDGILLKLIQNHQPNLQLFGIDLTESPEWDKLNNINFTVSNAEQTQFTDNQFDLMICSMTLHHFQNPQLVFKEVFRILKPQGTFYLLDIMPKHQVSALFYNLIKCREPYHFEKFYTEDEVISIAKSIGWHKNTTELIQTIPRISLIKFSI